MNTRNERQQQTSPSDTAIDAVEVATRFESAWSRGEAVRLEFFLRGTSGEQRSQLLARLLPIELDWRRRRGEQPLLETYHRRFPADGPVVAEAFAATESRLSRALGESAAAGISQLSATAEGPPGAGSPAEEVPGRIGRYEIEGEIDRGGMGLILRGRDPVFGRELAFKVMRSSLKDKPSAVSRFVTEAQIMGQLQHPGITPVHELGRCDDGRPYFSMKLIKGHTLERLLRDRNSPAQDLPRFLKIFEQICQTVAYAHSRGVVHRDLKPLNVMVGAFGELQIMDWGLATRIGQDRSPSDEETSESSVQTLTSDRADVAGETMRTAPTRFDSDDAEHMRLTQHGQAVGTFPYVPPEQARGEIQNMDERCDVFGLGAILCEILTGKPPYTGESGAEIIEKARRGDLQQALERLEKCGADAQLVTLARLCLAADPKDRSRNGQVVADIVTNYLVDQQYFNTRRQIELGVARERERLVQHYSRIAMAVCILVLLPLFGGLMFLLVAFLRARLQSG